MTKQLEINGYIVTDSFNNETDTGELKIGDLKVLDYKTTPDGKKLLHFEGDHSKIVELFIYNIVEKGGMI